MASSDPSAALAAHDAYYAAFRALDLERMEAAWARRPSDVCVHPGWPPQVGWPAIRESWRGIFAHTGFLRIEVRGLVVEAGPLLARVSGVESLYAVATQGTTVGQVAFTNVLVRTAQGWRVTVHHASPMPTDAGFVRPGPADPSS